MTGENVNTLLQYYAFFIWGIGWPTSTQNTVQVHFLDSPHCLKYPTRDPLCSLLLANLNTLAQQRRSYYNKPQKISGDSLHAIAPQRVDIWTLPAHKPRSTTRGRFFKLSKLLIYPCAKEMTCLSLTEIKEVISWLSLEQRHLCPPGERNSSEY